MGVSRRVDLTTSALLSWELCLSMSPACVTCPSLCLFPLAPCSSAWLSLCPSVPPSSLPYLLPPLCGLLLSLTVLYLGLSQHLPTPPLASPTFASSRLPSFPVCLSVQWHRLFLFTCLSSLPCQPCLSPSPSLSPSAFREGSGDL